MKTPHYKEIERIQPCVSLIVRDEFIPPEITRRGKTYLLERAVHFREGIWRCLYVAKVVR